MENKDLFLTMISCYNDLVKLSNNNEFKDDWDFHLALQDTAIKILAKSNSIK